MSNNLNLALPIYRDAIPPGTYGGFTDTERPTDCRPAAKVIDSVLDVHAPSMAWQTGKSSAKVIHGIPGESYKEGMETINDRIRSLIDSSGQSQAAVARAIGVKRATVGDWYHARSKYIRPENLEALAKHFHVDSAWLASGKGDPKPPTIDPDSREILRYLSRLTPASRIAIRDMVRNLAEDQATYHP